MKRAVDWFRQALAAPVADVGPIRMGAVYRGMVLAFEGLGDEEQLLKALKSWHNVATFDRYFDSECSRLMWKFVTVRTEPEFQYMLGRI